VPQPAAIPGRIVGSPLDHRAAGGDFHAVGEDSVRPVHRLDNVHLRKVLQRLRPIHRRQLLRQIERLRRANQIFLLVLGGNIGRT
jgi:hypothetical protein